jgi:transposase-like protein
MDGDRRSAQVERLEVVDTGRQRRWSEDEKLKIVLEKQAPRQVAATARRYGVSWSLLLRWRRLFRPEPKDAAAQQVGFVPARAQRSLPDDRRHGDRDPIRSRLLVAGAVASGNAATHPYWPRDPLARCKRILPKQAWPLYAAFRSMPQTDERSHRPRRLQVGIRRKP